MKLRSLNTRASATPSGCVLNWAHTASVNPKNTDNAMNFNVDSDGNVESNNDNRDNTNNEVRCVGR